MKRLAPLVALLALLLQGCCTSDIANPAPAAAAPMAANPSDSCNPTDAPAARMGAAAPNPTNVYTPVCGPLPEGYKPYATPNCNPMETLGTQLGAVQCPLRGMGIPGLECQAPAAAPLAFVQEAPAASCAPPAAAAPCAPAPAAAAAPSGCGPLPPEAKCGEVWCCVKVQPPAAAPQRVCVKEECQVCVPVEAKYETRSETYQVEDARCEWQRVECAAAGESECWKLVEIPAKFATRQFEVCTQPASVRHEKIPAVFEMRASAPPPAYYQWRRSTECEAPAPAAAGFPPTGAIGSPDGAGK